MLYVSDQAWYRTPDIAGPSFVIFLILTTIDRQTWHFNDRSSLKSEEFADVNFSLFVWVSGL